MRISTDDIDSVNPEANVDVAEFEACCAISIMNELEGDKEAFDKVLKGAEDNAAKGMLLYAATDQQKDVVAALERNGYAPVTKCKNPSSQRIITLFAKVITPAPAARQRAARTGAGRRARTGRRPHRGI